MWSTTHAAQSLERTGPSQSLLLGLLVITSTEECLHLVLAYFLRLNYKPSKITTKARTEFDF